MNQYIYNKLNNNLNIQNAFEESTKIIKNNKIESNLNKSNNSINFSDKIINNESNLLIKVKSDALLMHNNSNENLFNFLKNLKCFNKNLQLTKLSNQTIKSKKDYLNENLIKSFNNLPCTSKSIDDLEFLSLKQLNLNKTNTLMFHNRSTPILNYENKQFFNLIMPSLITSNSLKSSSANFSQNCAEIPTSNSVNFNDNINENKSIQTSKKIFKSYKNNIYNISDNIDITTCESNASNQINNNFNNKNKNNKYKLSIKNSPKIEQYLDYNNKIRKHYLNESFDLKEMLLLQNPILPPNSHFFCCFYKFHITVN